MALQLQDGTDLLLQDGTTLDLQSEGGVTPTVLVITDPLDWSGYPGETAVFSVLASGGTAPYTYQWYETTAGLIAGQTDAQLGISVALEDDGESYYCIATDSVLDTVQSGTADLSVRARPESANIPAVNYPDFFPCPTWDYSQSMSAYRRRTTFDNGWTRQRRQWPEIGTAVSLTWTMKTSMFDNWHKWITANGHDWFWIPLDRFGGVKEQTEVRLSTGVEWVYNEFDTVIATATGEIARTFSDCYAPPWDTCKEYKCDAFQLALQGVVDRLWLCDTSPYPDPLIDVLASEPLVAVGTPAAGPAILQNQCNGAGGSIQVGEHGYVSVNPISYSTSLRGGFGGFFQLIDANAINALFAETGGTNSPAITITPSSSGITVQWHPAASGPTYLYPVSYTGQYVWLNFEILDTTGDTVNIELFVDWVSQGTQQLTRAWNLSLPTEMKGFHLGNGSGNGSQYVEMVGYLDGNLTVEQAATLADALAQNDPAYVDPDPNCTPAGGQ